MALYAYGEDLIAAWDAEPNGRYWCLECSKPVKVRKGKNRIPHFYHLLLSPSCRLYSKSEDHLLLQLQIQNLFPPKQSTIERLFPEIRRISDVVCEKEKIAFEIQCSTIYPTEVARRMDEYQSLGYQVVWILDDRAFNKRHLHPAEDLMRSHGAYFATFRRHFSSHFYDQFEIFTGRKRVKKSRPLSVNLQSPRAFPAIEPPEDWPEQIAERIKRIKIYFLGDLLNRALLSSISTSHQLSLQNWAALEKHFKQEEGKNTIFEALKRPLFERLNSLIAEL